jgi:hypothetical protein
MSEALEILEQRIKEGQEKTKYDPTAPLNWGTVGDNSLKWRESKSDDSHIKT